MENVTITVSKVLEGGTSETVKNYKQYKAAVKAADKLAAEARAKTGTGISYYCVTSTVRTGMYERRSLNHVARVVERRV